MANATCLGVIIGNRDFFPDVLISEARRDLVKLFDELKIEPVWLSVTDSKLGAVETWADAQKWGELLGLSRGRMGAVGARPNAFNTTRFSEKLFEAAGITVNTIDLSEVFGNAARISSDDARVRQ